MALDTHYFAVEVQHENRIPSSVFGPVRATFESSHRRARLASDPHLYIIVLLRVRFVTCTDIQVEVSLQ